MIWENVISFVYKNITSIFVRFRHCHSKPFVELKTIGKLMAFDPRYMRARLSVYEKKHSHGTT